MLLTCTNISKSFGDNTILSNCSFHIEDYDKVAIVGINGAGKTTLLKILISQSSADTGLVTFAKDKTFGYLAQRQAAQSENTIWEEVLSVKQPIIDMEIKIRDLELAMKHSSGAELEDLMDSYSSFTFKFESENGYAYKSEVTGVLKGLGFEEEEFTKKISTLSGGQKTRVALGKLLLQNPNLIILDEPTNHLDMASITWLETYLLNYKGAVIIVSHDRYFLDRIANKVVEIDATQMTTYTGNYSDYAIKKEQIRAAKLHAYINQQKEIKHQQEVIEKLKSFNREKSIRRAESREKMLDKIELLEKPVTIINDMKICLEPKLLSGNDVLQVEELTKSFGQNLLFSNLTFQMAREERVALIGNNGTGKTTILKLINELLPPDCGQIILGSNVHVGYYDQEHNVLHDNKNLMEEISDDYPTLTNTKIRNVLAAFLFTGDDVFKKIGDLSGGEKGRISLAKLMLSEANFLILDEPTNHLDMMSKEILESALRSYTGTILFVSHDRYFINRVATRILDLTSFGLMNYLGNYDYYLEKRNTLTPQTLCETTEDTISETKTDWKEQKELQSKQRKKENDLKKIEAEIETLENRQEAIESTMLQPEVTINVAKLQELHKESENNSLLLASLYEKWENLV